MVLLSTQRKAEDPREVESLLTVQVWKIFSLLPLFWTTLWVMIGIPSQNYPKLVCGPQSVTTELENHYVVARSRYNK